MRTTSRLRSRGLALAVPFIIATSPALSAEIVEPGETQVFTAIDRCDGTPFEDTIFRGTNSACVEPARVEAAAILSVAAINSNVTAFSTVFADFLVSGDNGSVLDATVSAAIDWDGVLFGAGVLGAGARVKVELILFDETDGVVKASREVVNRAQDSTGLKGIDIGGTRFAGAEEVSLQGTVVRGHEHSIQLKLTCAAESGLVGLDVGCIYMNDVFGINLGGDPHAKWTSLSITVSQDIFERLDEIEAKIDLLDDKMDEVIRLLLTPQGRRSTTFLDCDDEDDDGVCDFPLKWNNGRRRGRGR